MSKRRNRNANVSQETLERARRQAAETTTDDADGETAAAPARVEPPVPHRARATVSATPRRAGQSTLRKRKEDEKMSAEEVAERLANPTKNVTEAELRAHYNYVVADLRSMGILAASLMIALVILAQFLPR